MRRRIMSEPESNYTVSELRVLWGRSDGHIRNLISSGKLRAVKDGSRTLIPESAVREYVDSIRRPGTDSLIRALGRGKNEGTGKDEGTRLDFAVELASFLANATRGNAAALKFLAAHHP